MSVLKKALRQLLSIEDISPEEVATGEEANHTALDNSFDFDSVSACPACGSNNVAIYVYGKPQLSRRMVEGLESGKIISGGCMIRKTAPKWHCRHCNKDFGRLL